MYVMRSSMPTYEEYIKAIKPLWDSHCLTNMGTFHEELESQLKEFLHVPEVSLMVNGHMALELAIQAMDFPAGSEVITTPFTFISTTHAIIRNNLIPVFCDVKETDGTIDEMKIERLISNRTVAILPVHVYGHICNVEAIEKIAKQYDLKVIYDAAHAFGEEYQGIGVGKFGDASIFSFHATKVFNTIEGGAVTFANHKLYEKLYNLKNFGIRGKEVVVEVGTNAKMNEFSAIMGLCNLQHFEEEIEKRKKRYEYYRESLSHIRGIRMFEPRSDIKYNYAYLPIRVNASEYGMSRDELFKFLERHNIFARKYFFPLITRQNCFRDRFNQFSVEVAEAISDEILTLPLYADLEFEIIDKIVDLAREAGGD